MKLKIAVSVASVAQLVALRVLAQQPLPEASDRAHPDLASEAKAVVASDLDPARIPEAHGTLGMEAYHAGDFEAASRHFQAAQQYAGIRWGSWLARSLEKQGLLLEARKHYVQVIAVPLGANAPYELKQLQSEAHRELFVLHARIPKLVLQVRAGEGQSVVSVDDRVVNVDRGRAVVQLNPGQHRVTAVRADGSYKSQWINVSEAQQRRFEFDFAEAGAIEPASDPVLLQPAPAARSDSTLVWALGAWGVGAAGFVSALWLTESANHEARGAVSRCQLNCSASLLRDSRDSVDDKRVGAAVSLGVGLIGAITGTVLYFERRNAERASLQLGVSAQGALAGYFQRF